MGTNFTDFGDLVLLIGDVHVPQRAAGLPACFKELLSTDKIRHVLCTGNLGCAEMSDQLKQLAGSVHIVRGDMDSRLDLPDYKVIEIGQFRVGLIHGHQIVPWDCKEAKMQWLRKFGCDMLVSGHSHINGIAEVEGKYLVNPGSATGSFQAFAADDDVRRPSFMLMAVQGASVVLYVYEEREGKASVVMSELHKSNDQGSGSSSGSNDNIKSGVSSPESPPPPAAVGGSGGGGDT
eukprot:GHVS01039055.1.p1 GENE.GHVS01039055.1~~GHVS01039055.1.p1  ORF type:complete len:261 (+),score=95.35 GHVS01039055.1:79-783(+)